MTIDLFGAIGQHSAAQHTDITRARWIPAQMMTLDGATRVQLGVAPDIIEVIQMADAATQGCYFDFLTPDDYASGAISIQFYWAPGATDGTAHTVRWQIDSIERIAGQDVTAAGTTSAFTGVSSAKTLNQLQMENAQNLLTPGGTNRLVRSNVRRLGADGADTYVGAVNFIGALLTWTAVQ